VFLSDGTHVNHTLVKEGWCWWCRKYAPGDTVLEGLEKEAREARKGVWADPQPVPPGAGLFLLPIFYTASTRQIFRPARTT
jgi:endonuclease YncB( thermonuclease family)